MQLIKGDALDRLKELEANSIDSCITDPPYGLSAEPDMAEVLSHWLAGDDYSHKGSGFMGKSWDSFVPGPAVWKEIYRVLKPGGVLLAMGGTRTIDLLSIAIRLGGFQKFDEFSYHYMGTLPPMIDWIHGQGFPKNYNIAKGIEGKLTTGSANWSDWKSLKGDTIEEGSGHIGSYQKNQYKHGYRPGDYTGNGRRFKLDATTQEAKDWKGIGTALKPAHEIILCFYKPRDKDFATNALIWGTSGINIDATRVPFVDGRDKRDHKSTVDHYKGYGEMEGSWANHSPKENANDQDSRGRWPSNIIHDGSAEILVGLPEGKGRFFYCAKPTKKEKDMGLEGFEERTKVFNGKSANPNKVVDPDQVEARFSNTMRNIHPTVKPLALMRYLVRLVKMPTPVTVLDPYMGSGTTGVACVLEDVDFIGIELDEDGYSMDIARARIKWAIDQKVEAVTGPVQMSLGETSKDIEIKKEEAKQAVLAFVEAAGYDTDEAADIMDFIEDNGLEAWTEYG